MTIEKSKYLEFFKTNTALAKECLEVVGDILLVEPLKLPEVKTASGIILTEAKAQMGSISADKPTFVRVLLPGEGYYDDTTKEAVPLSAAAGDIILVGHLSIKKFSMMPLLESYEPDTLAITRESDIQIRFKGEEAFLRFLGQLNQGTKKQVVA